MVEHLAASGRATPVCPPDGPTAAPRLRSEHVDEDLIVRGELTGLLLRSAAVSGWTGLEVKAYAGADEKSTKLRLLRMDRLAPDILICIFRGVPQTVDIEEPREGLALRRQVGLSHGHA